MLSSIERMTDEQRADRSDRFYDTIKLLRTKYSSPTLELDQNEVRLDSLRYALAILNVAYLAGPHTRDEVTEISTSIKDAVEGRFNSMKMWLEYHGRPTPGSVIQSEINLANLL
jgi:hypothetical protein